MSKRHPSRADRASEQAGQWTAAAEELRALDSEVEELGESKEEANLHYVQKGKESGPGHPVKEEEVSGRLTSLEPSLQVIPKGSKEGRQFTPRSRKEARSESL